MLKLKIDPKKQHRISPYLYMQFMEPLGVADPSVDAAWDFTENDWHSEVIDMVRDLAPTMVRFGGTFIDYYHWKEAVGSQRVPMKNHCWGGIYQNQVGTHEVIDFCRRVNAEPLLMVRSMPSCCLHPLAAARSLTSSLLAVLCGCLVAIKANMH